MSSRLLSGLVRRGWLWWWGCLSRSHLPFTTASSMASASGRGSRAGFPEMVYTQVWGPSPAGFPLTTSSERLPSWRPLDTRERRHLFWGSWLHLRGSIVAGVGISQPVLRVPLRQVLTERSDCSPCGHHRGHGLTPQCPPPGGGGTHSRAAVHPLASEPSPLPGALPGNMSFVVCENP